MLLGVLELAEFNGAVPEQVRLSYRRILVLMLQKRSRGFAQSCSQRAARMRVLQVAARTFIEHIHKSLLRVRRLERLRGCLNATEHAAIVVPIAQYEFVDIADAQLVLEQSFDLNFLFLLGCLYFLFVHIIF